MIRSAVISLVALCLSQAPVKAMDAAGQPGGPPAVTLVKVAQVKPAFNKAAAPRKPTYKTPKPALKPVRARTPAPRLRPQARPPRASSRPSARVPRAKPRGAAARQARTTREAFNQRARTGTLRRSFNKAAARKPLKRSFNTASRPPLRASFNKASKGGPPRNGAWSRGGGNPPKLRPTFRKAAGQPKAKPAKSNLQYRVNVLPSGVVNPRSMITAKFNKLSGASKTVKSQFRKASGTLAPKYLKSKNGQKVPLPKNALGPYPTKTLKTGRPNGGVFFQGGPGGQNVTRLMPPRPARGKAPAYPNGYFQHQLLTRGPNGKISRQIVAGPNSRKTISKSDPRAHVPFL